MEANILKKLAEHNKKYNGHIKSLQLVMPDNDEYSDGINDDTDEGKCFGGRDSKKDKKKKIMNS